MLQTIKILIMFFVISSFSQNLDISSLYIYDEDYLIRTDEKGILNYYIIIKSKDTVFVNDTYKFNIPNQSNFNEYKSFNNVKKRIVLDTINYIKKSDLYPIKNWKLHEHLSSQKEIFLITQGQKGSSKKPEFYFCKIFYEGTQKNLEFLKL